MYLITLKAYVAELLRRHDLMFYIEGGRSYSGEMKSPKTGLLHAALQAEPQHMVIIPTAIAYDLVLEDFILSRQKVKRSQRPFARELAEMVRYAVGYRSRAITTFGAPISVDGWDPASRRDILDLAHRIIDTIGHLVKVMPTALFASALRRSMGRREAEVRAEALTDKLRAAKANLGFTDVREAMDRAARAFEARGIIVIEQGRFRIRERHVLRYYARTIDHLLPVPPDQTALMLGAFSKAFFHTLSQSGTSSAWHPATDVGIAGIRAPVHRRRNDRRRRSTPPASWSRAASRQTLDYLGESVSTSDEADTATREYLTMIDAIVAAGIGRNISLKLTQLGLDLDARTCLDNLRTILGRRGPARVLRADRHGELALRRSDAQHLRNAVAARACGTSAS